MTRRPAGCRAPSSGAGRRTPTTGSSPRPRWPTAAGSPTSGFDCLAERTHGAGPGAPPRPTRPPGRTSGSARWSRCSRGYLAAAAGWSATSARPTRTRPAADFVDGLRGRRAARRAHRRDPRRRRAATWCATPTPSCPSWARPSARWATGSSRPTPTSAPSRSSTACEEDAQIVLGGRLADPSLFVGPICHELGWALDDWDRRRPRHAGRAPARVRRAQHRRQLRGPAVPGRARPAPARLPVRRGRRDGVRGGHQAAGHRRRGRRADHEDAALLRDPRPGAPTSRPTSPPTSARSRIEEIGPRPGPAGRRARRGPAGHAQGARRRRPGLEGASARSPTAGRAASSGPAGPRRSCGRASSAGRRTSTTCASTCRAWTRCSATGCPAATRPRCGCGWPCAPRRVELRPGGRVRGRVLYFGPAGGGGVGHQSSCPRSAVTPAYVPRDRVAARDRGGDVVKLREIAYSRSGDKGDTSNICVFVVRPGRLPAAASSG